MSKKILALIFLLIAGIGYLSAQDLTLRIENADIGKGHLMIGIFNNADDFPSKTFREQSAAVTDKTMVITFPDLPAGQYAVSVFQDSNDNGKLDTAIFGIPSEKYGFSNGVRLPNYKKCLFDFNNDMTVTVQIK